MTDPYVVLLAIVAVTLALLGWDWIHSIVKDVENN